MTYYNVIQRHYIQAYTSISFSESPGMYLYVNQFQRINRYLRGFRDTGQSSAVCVAFVTVSRETAGREGEFRDGRCLFWILFTQDRHL